MAVITKKVVVDDRHWMNGDGKGVKTFLAMKEVAGPDVVIDQGRERFAQGACYDKNLEQRARDAYAAWNLVEV